jgi:hypothetical protein
MPKKKKPINPQNEWGNWNRLIAKEADNIFTPTPKTSDMKVLTKWNIKNPKVKGIRTEATQSSNKWTNSIKHYAKLYEISVLDDKGKPKSVNKLSNEIYAFERENKPADGLYPFLNAK